MITIALIIAAVIMLLLSQIGVIKNPIVAFLIVAIIIGACAFIFKDKLNCPFAQKCPFTICPLNKK